MIIDIKYVFPSDLPSPWRVNRMKGVLQNQGQIEPLQVRHLDNGTYTTFGEDPWGNEIIYAAREIGWPTLLVTVEKEYQQ